MLCVALQFLYQANCVEEFRSMPGSDRRERRELAQGAQPHAAGWWNSLGADEAVGCRLSAGRARPEA
jgi:hypothetical protein